MKVPLSWLREYVAFDASPEALAERLTFSGTEVTAVQTVGPELTGVVVGEILAVAPHPRADRLRLCRVSDGRQTHAVVCGAQNFEAGAKAAFAPVGCVLPGGKRIEPAVIRGESSAGMLCAEDELGLSDDHAGILLVPAEAAPGTPLSDVVGPADVVLEIDVTWNRPDCLCIIGIAREVAALSGSRLRLPAADVPEAGEAVRALADVVVEDPDGCPRYTGRVLSGVTLRPSPLWMRRRLTLCGVRPINNVVDITNYVMLECGQPLHAFDYDLLQGHRIVVRRARAGERLATLDGIDRPITPEMVVIADAGRPVALAGIMGGAGSEIRAATRRVLLESAYFDPARIHATSQRLGLGTESSHRFERGVDLGGVEWASRRAAHLMVAHADADAAAGVLDVFPRRPPPRAVRCRFEKFGGLLGLMIGADETVAILSSLGLEVAERDAETCTVRIPTFRPDLEIEADLIEEVARIHGLDQVSAATPEARINPEIDDAVTRALDGCRLNLIGLGLAEIVNYSFVSHALLDGFWKSEAARRVVLPNPVSADYAVLRDSLIPQMVETLGRNLAHQNENAALFEIGRVFLRDANGKHEERDRVAVGLIGRVGRTGPDARRLASAEEMFLWLKGLTEALLRAQRVGAWSFEAADGPGFEPGWSLLLTIGGHACGRLGLVAEPIRREWRMSDPVGVAEFEASPLLGVSSVPKVQPLPAFPGITRDVALIVAERVRHADVVRTIEKNSPAELTAVELFDIFRSEGIGAGRKSMAYSLVYRSSERTLTDEDANRYHDRIKAALRSELKAEIREN